MSLLGARVRRRRRKRRLAFATPLAACLVIAAALLHLVYAGPAVGIPEAVSDYMLMTGPFDFSSAELRSLISSSEPPSRLSAGALLLVYWVYFASFGILGLLLAFAPFARRAGLLRSPSWDLGLIEAGRIESALLQLLESRSLAAKISVLRVVYRPRLHSLVSPFRKGWYKKPEHQWLQLDALDPEVRSILSTLSLFDDCLLGVVTMKVDPRQAIEAIRVLSDFFFAVASRADPVLRRILPKADHSHEAEREILCHFAAVARPCIIEIARVRRSRKRPARVVTVIFGVLRARIVRGALTISSGTAQRRACSSPRRPTRPTPSISYRGSTAR